MKWKVTKEFRFSDNYVNVEIRPNFSVPTGISIVGHQNFTKEQWKALWLLAGMPEPEIEKSYGIGNIRSSFEVTTNQLEEAGVAFLVEKSNRNWATSTFVGDVNPYFNTMSVSEMLTRFGLM